MNAILRLLGIELLARVATRLPGPWARIVSLGVLLVANAVPVLGVWQGWLGFGDVFLLYWLENVVVWLTSSVRIMTAGSSTVNAAGVGLAAFFALHYGIFTLVHGVFTLVLTALAGGLKGAPFVIALSLFLLILSHVVNLAFFWFAHDGRLLSTPQRAMVAPYPRMIVLHISVIGSGFFLFGGLTGEAERHAQFWPVLLLCGLKTLVDLGGVLVADRVRTPSR